jgi:predicted GIY-YIG superfamily endonuclease
MDYGRGSTGISRMEKEIKQLGEKWKLKLIVQQIEQFRWYGHLLRLQDDKLYKL